MRRTRIQIPPAQLKIEEIVARVAKQEEQRPIILAGIVKEIGSLAQTGKGRVVLRKILGLRSARLAPNASASTTSMTIEELHDLLARLEYANRLRKERIMKEKQYADDRSEKDWMFQGGPKR